MGVPLILEWHSRNCGCPSSFGVGAVESRVSPEFWGGNRGHPLSFGVGEEESQVSLKF